MRAVSAAQATRVVDSRFGCDTLSRVSLSACFFVTLLLSGPATIRAADLYWVCGDDDWDSFNTGLCWATTPGGVATVAAPSLDDDIHLTQSGGTNIAVEYFAVPDRQFDVATGRCDRCGADDA